MEVVKITKKMLKLGPYEFLLKLKAISEIRHMTFPNHVYVSKADYTTLTRGISAFEILAYAPNTSLQKAIKSGYVLVDYEAIKKESWLMWEK